MGLEVQAISWSPFQFMYSLDPEHGRKTARAINENLAAIVQKHPDRFVALADVPLQAPDAAAEELDYCVRRLGFRGVEIGTNVVGKRSEEHTSELQSLRHLVCRLLLEKKKKKYNNIIIFVQEHKMYPRIT